jgi:hypothetical protein
MLVLLDRQAASQTVRTDTMTINPNATTDRNRYGAVESNGLVDGAAYHAQVDYSGRPYSLKQVADEGGRITRVRILAEMGRGDVSYIHATLPNGTTVPVQVMVDNLTPLKAMKGALINWAKREGVYAKALGLLDEGNWSVQR